MRPAKEPAYSKTVCPMLKGSVAATPALLIRPATGFTFEPQIEEDEMRKVGILLLVFLMFPVSTFAAQVFGNIKFDNRSVGEGVLIRIRCPEKMGKEEKYLKTDRFGSYSDYLPAGKCTFEVNYGNEWTIPYDIYADESDPVRYDFELVRNGDGRLRLERK